MGTGGGGETRIEKEPSLSPMQQRIAQQLATYFGGRIGKPMEGYPGQMVAGMGGMERMGLGQLRQAMGERPMYQGALKQALGGMRPEAMTRFYEEAVAPEQQRMFQQQVLPQIAESYQAAGLGTSQDRARAEAEAAQRMQEFGGGQLAQLIMRGREMGQAAIPMGMQAEQAQMQEAMAGMQAGALPRMLRQQEMETRMQEFMRTRPEMSPVIQQALSFMGQPQLMGYGTQEPGRGMLEQLMRIMFMGPFAFGD